MKLCPYWDSGWCYHPDLVRNQGCPGSVNCEWFKENLKEEPQGSVKEETDEIN